MKNLLIALALVDSLAAHAQAPATISGQLSGCSDSTTVSVFEPIAGGRLNYFFSEGPNQALVRNGQFRYKLRHPSTSMLLLMGKCVPQLWVFAEPGAQVGFTRSSASGDAVTYAFSGLNAAANDLLGNRRLLNDGPSDQARVSEALAAPTATAAMSKLQALLQPCLDQLDDLYKQRKITKVCHDFLQAETEQRLLFWASGPLAGYLKDSAAAPLHLAMSRRQAKALVTQLYTRYDPDQPRYRLHTLGMDREKARLSQRGVLPAGAAPADHLWSTFHQQFQGVDDNIDDFDYVPLAGQEHGVGSAILNAVALKTMSAPDLTAVVAAYQQRFPAGAYTPVLRRVTQAQASAATSSAEPIVFGLYTAGSKGLVAAARPGLDTVRTLSGLVRSQRPGRAVFVDIWATWCGPCLAEFSHEPELHEFLASNDVDILYLSVDRPALREKWTSLLTQYRLQGYHYLAPPALQKALEATVSYIPRYLLFNKEGKLVEASTYRPSETNKLRQQVRERLQ